MDQSQNCQDPPNQPQGNTYHGPVTIEGDVITGQEVFKTESSRKQPEPPNRWPSMELRWFWVAFAALVLLTTAMLSFWPTVAAIVGTIITLSGFLFQLFAIGFKPEAAKRIDQMIAQHRWLQALCMVAIFISLLRFAFNLLPSTCQAWQARCYAVQSISPQTAYGALTEKFSDAIAEKLTTVNNLQLLCTDCPQLTDAMRQSLDFSLEVGVQARLSHKKH